MNLFMFNDGRKLSEKSKGKNQNSKSGTSVFYFLLLSF